MADTDNYSYSEPESGTDLDDPNLRDQDDQELQMPDEVPHDEEAELEAREMPLGPAQRRAAERELAMRDMQERNAVLPQLLRQDLQRQFQNENLAEQLRQVQLQPRDEEEIRHYQRETPNAVSSISDPSRYFAYQMQRLKLEYPQKDSEFRQTLRDLRAQPTGALIEHAVQKTLYFLKTAQKQDITTATGRAPIPKYVERANELLGDQSRSSLEIEAIDLAEYNMDLVMFLVEVPGLALHIFDVAVTRFLLELEPALQQVHAVIKARITVSSTGKALESLPDALKPIALSKLNTQSVGRLVCARGIVVQKTARQARLVLLFVRCLTCGNVMGPINMQAVTGIIGAPGMQVSSLSAVGGVSSFKSVSTTGLPRKCLNAACGSVRLTVSSESVYEDVVVVTLQEGQDDVENGHVPHRREAVLSGDLVSRAEPGSALRITGVYSASPDNVPGLYATYATHLEANGVAFDGPGGQSRQNVEQSSLYGSDAGGDGAEFGFSALGSGLDGGEIRALQQLPKLFRGATLEKLLLRSLAPSLGGSETAKRALLCAMIGGVSRRAGPGGPRTRGDIHLLLLGDPGVAKSQLLRAAGRIAPKAVLATGRGASAAGLTVAVKRDASGTFSLQAGALVLASNGVCLVDELDKMTQVDRVALHQAMEQQEVSIAKAGIIATLPARAAVIAAANPNGQRYNVNLPLQHNVDIGEALLSRFDLVVVMRDEIDRDKDTELAKFIIQSHAKATGGDNLEDETHDENRQDNQQNDENDDGDEQFISEIDEALSIPAVVGYLQRYQVEAQENAILPARVLRAYIALARTVEPTISQDVVNRVSTFYHDIRGLGSSFGTGTVEGEIGSGPQAWSAPTQRAIGTAFRVIEAHAKLHLRQQIQDDDVAFGLGLLAELFVQQQKRSLQRRTERALARYLYGLRVHEGVASGAADGDELINTAGMFAVLDGLFRQLNVLVLQGVVLEARVRPAHLRAEAQRLGVQFVDAFFRHPALAANYRLVYGQNGELEAIFQRGQ